MKENIKSGNIIGRRLKYLRGERSQGDMANILDITQAYLCEIEKGRRIPSFDLLCDFAEKLNTRISFLIGEDQELLFSELSSRTASPLADDDSEESARYRGCASIERLLAYVKERIRNENSVLRQHDKDAISHLLVSCLSALEEETAADGAKR